MSTCKSCGKTITWVVSRHGKPIPCDTISLQTHVKPGTVVVTPEGEVQRVKAGDQIYGYTSHWSTCPHADTHRREARRKKEEAGNGKESR